MMKEHNTLFQVIDEVYKEGVNNERTNLGSEDSVKWVKNVLAT